MTFATYSAQQKRNAKECHIDKETFSACDLIKCGAYKYARHPSTDIHCVCYAFDDGPVALWLPGMPYPFKGFKGIFYAWNAQFERQIWWNVLHVKHRWPKMKLERFKCVAAMARAAALPGKLDKAGRCMNVVNKKDRRGEELIKLLCIPQEDGSFCRDDDLLAELYDYCAQDVRTERDLETELRPLSDYEWQVYWQCERINDRGVGVDLAFAQEAVAYAEEEKAFFGSRLAELTEGKVTTARQFAKIKEWVWPHLSEAARKMCFVYKGGEKKISFDKNVRHNLLESLGTVIPMEGRFMSDEAVEFTEIVDLAGNSSISKYQSMLDIAVNGRANGLYICFGAGQTGRASSVKLQLHNMLRAVLLNDADIRTAFMSGDEKMLREVTHTNSERKQVKGVIPLLAHRIRPSIKPTNPKAKMLWGDWSAIEAKALPWLSKDPEAEPKLQMFRDGVDVYKRNAAMMGFDPVAGRQTGKVTELSLGYGGGVGAFQAMARGYQVKVPDKLADEIKHMWRDDNPWAKRFWHALENAAISAMLKPGEWFEVGRVRYIHVPGIMNGMGALFCELPSGRYITYPGARLEDVDTPWGEPKLGITAIKGNWNPKAGETEWPRVTLWYGLLAENITQATCADILLMALLECEEAGLNVVMHTHDEIGIETTRPKRDGLVLYNIMLNPHDCFKGLPLDAEVESGPRYKVKDWEMAA